MLRSDLCDFSDAYIVVKGDITLTKDKNRGFIDIRNRFLAFRNKTLFTNRISKINNVLINNEKDLDVVTAMYNLLEYRKIIEEQQDVCVIITEMNITIFLQIFKIQIL